METQHTLSITTSPVSPPQLNSPISNVTSDPNEDSVMTSDLDNLDNRSFSPALDVTTP